MFTVKFVKRTPLQHQRTTQRERNQNDEQGSQKADKRSKIELF